jgi:LPXTG-motif cell wall-anchored protein
MFRNSVTSKLRRRMSTVLIATSVVVGAIAISQAPVSAGRVATAVHVGPPMPTPCVFGALNSTGPVTFDNSFGTSGLLRVTGTDSNLIHQGPGGSLLLIIKKSNQAGNFWHEVQRYLPDGSPDQTWGVNGKSTLDFDPGNGGENLFATTTLSDGSVIARSSYWVQATSTNVRGIVKIGTDGNLVSTFGSNGFKEIPNSTLDSDIVALTRGSSGAYLAVTEKSGGTPSSKTYGIVKFQASGEIDTTFGVGGYLALGTFPLTGPTPRPSLTIDGDGNLYVGSLTTQEPFNAIIRKFSANGTVDPNFGTEGVLSFDTLTDSGTAEFVSSIDFNGGKITAAISSGTGTTFNISKFLRASTSGVLDGSFGTNGLTTFSNVIPGSRFETSEFSRLPDGGYLIQAITSTTDKNSYAKLASDGSSLTSTFTVILGTCSATSKTQTVVAPSGIFVMARHRNSQSPPDDRDETNVSKMLVEGWSTPTTTTTTTTTVPAATTTVPAATTTVPAVTTTVPATTTTVPAATTTVPPPALSTVQALPTAPTPIVADTSISIGEEISVSFGGFTPFEFVQLIVASTPQVIGSGYANAQGVVTLSGNLPSNLAAGNHTLAVYAPGSGVGFTQPITVSQPLLPATGSDGQNNLYVIAMLLFVLGLVVRRTSTVITNK